MEGGNEGGSGILLVFTPRALIGCYTIEGAALFNSRAPSLIILFLTLDRHFLSGLACL